MNPVDYSIGLLPWLILAAGAVLGGLATILIRRSAKSSPSRDGDLAQRDLEAQRDDAFARLRGETLEEVGPDERLRLELRAASLLRELEMLPSEKEAARPAPEQRHSPRPDRHEANLGFWARHKVLAGALLGGGAVLLVVVLVSLAGEDAEPRPDMPPAGRSGSSASTNSPARADSEAAPGAASQPPLPPFVAQQVETMRKTLSQSPSDVETRRRLALTLLSANQAFDAFQEANILLRDNPTDARALYVSGFVRYLMGQPAQALDQLDLATLSEPTYAQAWLVKGLIQLQTQDRQQAIDTWEGGLAALGGSDPRIEHLLREARTDKTVDEILASPPPGG